MRGVISIEKGHVYSDNNDVAFVFKGYVGLYKEYMACLRMSVNPDVSIEIWIWFTVKVVLNVTRIIILI